VQYRTALPTPEHKLDQGLSTLQGLADHCAGYVSASSAIWRRHESLCNSTSGWAMP
jgi:hypothetical protein